MPIRLSEDPLPGLRADGLKALVQEGEIPLAPVATSLGELLQVPVRQIEGFRILVENSADPLVFLSILAYDLGQVVVVPLKCQQDFLFATHLCPPWVVLLDCFALLNRIRMRRLFAISVSQETPFGLPATETNSVPSANSGWPSRTDRPEMCSAFPPYVVYW